MNGRLPFLDHASDLLLQLYPICLVLLFPHELIKRPLLIALHVPGHDHLRRACGLGHCVMAAPVPLRSFFSSAAAGKRSPLHHRNLLSFSGTRQAFWSVAQSGSFFSADRQTEKKVPQEVVRGPFDRRPGLSPTACAVPRIGDGYRKLSLTPTGVPNES